jgi:transcriptional regulator with PAS, ATPase and Fis domain
MASIVLLDNSQERILQFRQALGTKDELFVAPYPEALLRILEKRPTDLVFVGQGFYEDFMLEISTIKRRLAIQVPMIVVMNQYNSYQRLSLNQLADGVLEQPIDRQKVSQVLQVWGAEFSEQMLNPVENDDSLLWGRSKAMEILRKQLRRYAKHDGHILLYGESGSGKEVCARYIHEHSSRKIKPMRTFNCAGVARGLLETELFGSVQGAFTEAVNRPGWLEASNYSTLFLDEIAELELSQQSRLLRFFDNQTVVRIGACQELQCDVRIVAACNRNLEKMVVDGLFKHDLFFRLGTIVKIPPLREHLSDVPEYARRFAAEKACNISDKALVKLMTHHWPGNVRELKQVVHHGVQLCDEGVIRREDIRFNAWD